MSKTHKISDMTTAKQCSLVVLDQIGCIFCDCRTCPGPTL